MNLGTAIKKIRKEAGLSQQDLTNKAGISQTALSQIETGTKAPNSKTLEKICKAMEIPMSVLYVMAMEKEDVPESKQQDYERIFPYVEKLVMELMQTK